MSQQSYKLLVHEIVFMSTDSNLTMRTNNDDSTHSFMIYIIKCIEIPSTVLLFIYMRHQYRGK